MTRGLKSISLIFCAFFCWGVIGGVELCRLSLTQGIYYMLFALLLYASICILDKLSGFAKQLAARLIKRKRLAVAKAKLCRATIASQSISHYKNAHGYQNA